MISTRSAFLLDESADELSERMVGTERALDAATLAFLGTDDEGPASKSESLDSRTCLRDDSAASDMTGSVSKDGRVERRIRAV